MIAAHKAVVHLDAIHGHFQALQGLSMPDSIKRAALIADRVGISISEDVKKWGKIKPDEPAIFLPAFPRSEWRHVTGVGRKPRKTEWRQLGK